MHNVQECTAATEWLEGYSLFGAEDVPDEGHETAAAQYTARKPQQGFGPAKTGKTPLGNGQPRRAKTALKIQLS